MADNAIQLEGVHKYYGKVHALQGLNLEVKKGEIFGFLGPNGAGKTTTIRCLLDLIRPNQGKILIMGEDPQSVPQAVKSKVGYLPGDLSLEGDFTPRDFFRYIRRLRNNLRPWQDLLGLAERLELDLDKKIKTLSQGNKQKVGLIQALVSKAPLLMLDEPTLGLDPLMKQEVLNLIKEESAQGATVFFSSHILSEVHKTADRVGIIRKGTLVEIAQTNDLISRSITRATILFSESIQPTRFDDLDNIKILRVNDNEHAYTLEVTGEMDEFIKRLAEFSVRDIEIHKPSLEEVFLNYYKDEDREA